MGTPAKRFSYRLVKIHRSYTVDEVARLCGVAKITVRRWISSASLSALTDRKPMLVLGTDLSAFLKEKSRRNRVKLRLDQCYCLKCRAPRSPALGFVEFVPQTPTTGNMRAFCETCGTVMNKATSASSLQALARHVEVTIGQAEQHLMDSARARLNEHFREEDHAVA